MPLPWTDTVASVKLHDAAAQVWTADDSRRSSGKGRPRRCMGSGALSRIATRVYELSRIVIRLVN